MDSYENKVPIHHEDLKTDPNGAIQVIVFNMLTYMLGN